MQKLIRLYLVFAALFICFPEVAAQHAGTEARPESIDKRRSREFWNELREGLSGSSPGLPPIRREPRVIKKGLLAPTEQDRLGHERFLALPDTGLLRLLPREVYDSRRYKPPRRVDIRGGGAYFSFFYRSHEYGYGSDLELGDGKFHVGFAGADFGMLISLGDVALEQIEQTHPAYRFMVSYKPPSEEKQARLEFSKFRKGTTVDGMTYQRTLPVQVATTYLLRSIVYRRSDVLVAFRVARIDQDGSVIMAWRKLRSFRVPTLH